MFKKYFDAQDLITDGENGAYVRLPTNIPALPSNLHGKVMRADKLARLSTRIIPTIDMADEFHAAAIKGNRLPHIKALPITVRQAHMEDYNKYERIARRLENLASAYFLAVTQARYI